MIKTRNIVLILLFPYYLSSQNQFPNYHPPLKIPLVVAGNFGELRSSHFHTGLDFKTQQREGLPIYAIENGYVSRIKISPYGYGKVVYVNHPNGKTSVYAHCSRFLGELAQRVRAEQYTKQQFEIELFFPSDQIVVKKGEAIALSGNTGSSMGPHLHFEIRDTKTEYAQNPLIYAFDLSDNQAPQLRNIKIVAVNKQGYIVPDRMMEFPITATKQGYTVGDTLKIPSSFCSETGGIGIALDMVDFLDGAANKCGVYGTWIVVEGDTIFGHQQNEISFDHMRYVHTHRLGTSGSFHKLFRNENNPLNFYVDKQLGVMVIRPGQEKKVELIAYDPKGNRSCVTFVVKIQAGSISQDYQPSKDNFWYPQYGYLRKNSRWEIIADSNTIFEPIALDTKKTPHICQVGVALNKSATIRIKLEEPKLSVEKYYIAVQTKNGKRALSTTYNNGWLEAKTISSGDFSIQADTISPRIKLLSNTKKSKRIRWSALDNQSGLARYNLYIDNEWQLLEYEYKGNYVFFDVPDNLKGKHVAKIVLEDRCGNETIWRENMLF